MQSQKRDIKILTFPELSDAVNALGEPKFRTKQIYEWLHVHKVRSFEEMTNISKALRERLDELYYIETVEIVDVQSSSDGTKKVLIGLSDGECVESVLMKYKYGLSACISTQVGCRMGCSFCASGMDGVVRNLKASEIIDQVYALSLMEKDRIGHVVMMGMGEPLDNYENTIAAINLLSDEKGNNISVRNITLSTCGLVPGIRRLAGENLPITLAVSLHAAISKKREQMMPVAKSFGLDELMEACRYYYDVTKRRITYEYCVIPGINDLDEDAKALYELLKGQNAHVNLLGVHAVKEKGQENAPKGATLEFKKKVEKYGINVTIRRDLGAEIDGACGQLRRKRKDNPNAIFCHD